MECYHTKRNMLNLLKETNALPKRQLHIRDHHPTWKKIVHHQKTEGETDQSGNPQKLSDYFRLQYWDALRYAYVLIIKKFFFETLRAVLK